MTFAASSQGAPIRYAPLPACRTLGRTVAAPATDRTARLLLLGVFLAVTVLQRFAIPLGGEGDSQIAIAHVVSMAMFALMLVTGRMVIDPRRFMMFCWAATALLLTLVFGKINYSLTSVLLLVALSVPYAFHFRSDVTEAVDPIGLYRTLMTFLAVAGIVQFFIQFVVPRDFAYPMDAFIPETWFLHVFNTLIPLSEGSPYLKANGVVLLEPSHFSQFIGIALVLELLYYNSLPRLGLYAVALFVSFSGTGSSLVALFAPIVLLKRRKFGLLLVAALAVGLIVLLGQMIYFNIFIDRLAEFGSTRSSGFARFVGPFWFVGEYLLDDPQRLLFGMGPGSITQYVLQAAYFTHDTTWVKLLFEYGLVGFVAYFGFFLVCVFHRSPSLILSGMVFYCFLLLGGYLLATYMHFLFLALAVWHRPSRGFP